MRSERMGPSERIGRSERAGAGFTLLEMLVVLAVLAAAAAMVVPRLEARNAAVAMAGASSEVRAALRLARLRAIEERRPVTFDAVAGVGQYRVDGRTAVLATSRAAAAIRVQVATGSRISFYPSGGSSGGRVILWGPAGRREIDVSAVSGHADERP